MRWKQKEASPIDINHRHCGKHIAVNCLLSEGVPDRWRWWMAPWRGYDPSSFILHLSLSLTYHQNSLACPHQRVDYEERCRAMGRRQRRGNIRLHTCTYIILTSWAGVLGLYTHAPVHSPKYFNATCVIHSFFSSFCMKLILSSTICRMA